MMKNFSNLEYALQSHTRPVCCFNGASPETVQNWRQFAIPGGYAMWWRCPVCRSRRLAIVKDMASPIRKSVNPELFIDGYL